MAASGLASRHDSRRRWSRTIIIARHWTATIDLRRQDREEQPTWVLEAQPACLSAC